MIYSTLGTSEQIVSHRPLTGYIEMKGLQPSTDAISQDDGTWVIPFDKEKLLKGAYECQNKFLDTNFLLLISQRMYADNAGKPKTQVYVSFMSSLWTEYNTRKATQTVDYEFNFAPTTEYSYSEILQEITS